MTENQFDFKMSKNEKKKTSENSLNLTYYRNRYLDEPLLRLDSPEGLEGMDDKGPGVVDLAELLLLLLLLLLLVMAAKLLLLT